MNNIQKFINRDFKIVNKRVSVAAIVWFSLAVIALFIQLKKGPHGIYNYLIFKGVFWHTINETNLYQQYQADMDLNHYGPLFSIVIAPFALLPDILGCFLWGVANAIFLFVAVKKLPISLQNQHAILLIGALEMMTSMHNVQFNPMVTAWVIFSYVMVKNKKEFWATLFIALGILTKIYGVVGLAFFLFSENKLKFILFFIFWMLVLFFLPMVFSSPSFIISSYKEWYLTLSEKNTANEESTMQGMSAIRVIKRVFGLATVKEIQVLATATLCYLLPFLRFKEFKSLRFQLSYLAFLLIGIVIFSSSAESSTYVIAMMGVGIWFVIQPQKTPLIIGLLVFALVLTSLSTTDAFPKVVKVNYIRPYALKALPCLIIWLVLLIQLMQKKFTSYERIVVNV